MKKIFKYLLVSLVMMVTLPHDLFAHSVAQLQTTKYFHPDTVQMLVNRVTPGATGYTGTPGFVVGDTVSYIIEFTPVANGSNIGVQGYVTDYIPDGVEVVGASMVTKVGTGFVDIAPSAPGNSYEGWGRALATFTAPFNVNTYSAACAASAAGQCNGNMCQLQADTGIFYSTDPRTAQVPAMPTRILQGTAGNGITITPARAGQLNPLLGQTIATTHNQWDADQVLEFGAISNTPYNAGSPVAGPQTGYQFDNTAAVGPWQRIYYPGSRMGDSTPIAALNQPATAQGALAGNICGFTTSTGWKLSTTNQLPAGVNAVRWALGKLQVGELKYVKIDLRLTAPVPAVGLINASEVFGADTANGDPSTTILTGDNAWMYHVPSVADNNSNLLVLKKVIGFYDPLTPTVLTASDGSNIPMNSKLRYRITYLNSGNANQTNVVLSDQLPCQAGANSVSGFTVNSGPIGVGMVAPVVAAGTLAANCTAAGRTTFNFTPTVATLGPGVGGSIDYDVQLTGMVAATLYNVPNTAKLVSTEIPAGVSSTANAAVQTTPSPNLLITKTTSTPTATAGVAGSVTYTITVTNTGTAAATTINVYDILPASTVTGARFSYNAAGTVTGLTAVVPTPSMPPTLSPYNVGGVSANQQQVLWNFGVQTLAPGASFSITYTVTPSASIPSSAVPYYSTAAVTYTGGVYTALALGQRDAASVAPVTISSTLTITSKITHYYIGTTLVPYTNFIPAGAKVRYQLDYANTGAAAVSATVSNLLPCQTAVGSVSNIVATGAIPISPISPLTPAAGNCTTGVRNSFSFPATSIPANNAGTLTFDVQTNAVDGNFVVNTSTISGGGFSATSEVQTSVQSTPQLTISKAQSVASAKQGSTVTYTLTVTNTGTGNATNISILDWLPSGSAVLDAAVPPTTRFYYVSSTNTFVPATMPVVTIPPIFSPFNAHANKANMQELAWNFGTTSLAPGAQFTITYNATIGTNVPSATYGDNAMAVFSTTALTGTVSAANSVTMAGTGTAFNTQLAVGSVISIPGVSGAVGIGANRVTAIASATSMTLGKAATAAAGSLAYKTTQVNSNSVAMAVASFADLSITKDNGITQIAMGGTSSYTITVKNLGPDASNNSVIKDLLATGLTKTSVTCVASASAVCPAAASVTVAALEGTGITIPTLPVNGVITLTVGTTVTAVGGTVSNTATVATPTGVVDSVSGNNSATDTDTVIASNLSSTLTWIDANGGEQKPGDTIIYTLTLSEVGGLAAATGASVSNPFPANITSFKVTSVGSGVPNLSVGVANTVPATAGPLSVTGITVPLNGSITIVYEVVIGVTTPLGSLIDSTATVTNPTGLGGTAIAATLTVTDSSAPVTGMKNLYLYGSDSATGLAACTVAPCKMSRAQPANTVGNLANTTVKIARNTAAGMTWNLGPVLQMPVTMSSAITPAALTFPVVLNLAADVARSYNVKVELYCSNAVPVVAAAPAAYPAVGPNWAALKVPLTAGAGVGLPGASVATTFNLTTTTTTCPAGASWMLRVTNIGAIRPTGDRNIFVVPQVAAIAPSTLPTYSNVAIPSQNVISVSTVDTYTAACAGGGTVAPSTCSGGTISSAVPTGGVAYIRALVSDPFGSADITSASVTIKDPNNMVVGTFTMNVVANSGLATKTFEYPFTVSGTTGGVWTVSVTAKEGTENTVAHTRVSTFNVISIHHYELDVPTTGITCLPATVNVKACADASNPCVTTATGITGNITLATTAGTIGGVTLVAGVGSTTLNNPNALDNTTATVSITSVPTAASIVCSAANTSCVTTFSTAGFIISKSKSTGPTDLTAVEVTIASQVSGISDTLVNPYYLRAVKKSSATVSTTTQSCVAGLPAGANNVEFAYECINPSSCSAGNQLSVNGGVTTPVATGAIASFWSLATNPQVTMVFDSNGNAPFTFAYSDVGQIKLHAKATSANGTKLAGSSNAFVVAPHHFDVTVKCKSTATTECGAAAIAMTTPGTNPAAVNSAGGAFIPAGKPFVVTATAKNFANVITPNFGSETTPEVVTLQAVSNATACPGTSSCLVAPAGGSVGTFSTTTPFAKVSAGVVAGEANWSEVGIIQLRVANTSYLASSLAAYSAATNATDAAYSAALNVGRFYPDHFDTSVMHMMDCTTSLAALTPTCPKYTALPIFNGEAIYADQPFVTTVLAKNAQDGTTQNYTTGSFAKPVTLSAVDVNNAAIAGVVGGLLNGSLLATDFVAGQATTPAITAALPTKFHFSTPLTTPTNMYVKAADAEANSVVASPAAHPVQGGYKVVTGRIKIGNAVGSQLLPLAIPVTVQFYDGTFWQTSTTDSSTSISTNIFTNLAGTGNLNAGSYSAKSPGLATVQAGVLQGFKLAAPGVNGKSSLSFSATTANDISYLLTNQFVGVATFGVYQGRKEFIYLRGESY